MSSQVLKKGDIVLVSIYCDGYANCVGAFFAKETLTKKQMSNRKFATIVRKRNGDFGWVIKPADLFFVKHERASNDIIDLRLEHVPSDTIANAIERKGYYWEARAHFYRPRSR